MKSDANTSPTPFNINWRQFLQTTAAATLPSLGADALDIVHGKPKHVGLIGCGWYGKSDLWRLRREANVFVQ